MYLFIKIKRKIQSDKKNFGDEKEITFKRRRASCFDGKWYIYICMKVHNFLI
jgi:hypothetical protein